MESKSGNIAPKITVFSAVTAPIIAILVWIITTDKTLIDLNNVLFCTAILFTVMGSVTALVSKSRRHYYLHLKKKFAGKVSDSRDFDKEEGNRARHTKIGISFALGGVIHIGTCIVLLYV